MKKLVALTIAVVGLSFTRLDALQACPFCAAVQQTLRQEMSSMDAVVLAKVIGKGVTETDAEFEVLEVIKGGEIVKPSQKIRAAYFGSAPTGSSFLIMGVDPPELLWSSPLPVSATAVDYVKAIHKLPDSIQKQLEFYLKYLENGDAVLARDAYDEFAQAPYPDVKALEAKLDRQQVLKWIQDLNMSADRKRLYLVMLGICGKPEDSKLIEKMLKSEDPNQRAGLDAMIACYITLRGAEGLGLVEELFLKNKKSQYADTYSAIMALRFHGTEGGVVEKKRVVESLHLILQRPELADLVIPDLARWEDWSQIDKLVELFKNADEKTSWVRVPVINYLRACPLPVAAERLSELQKLDPAAYKRASTFFPIPQPAAPTPKQSTSTQDPKSVGRIANNPLKVDREAIGASMEATQGTYVGEPDLSPARPALAQMIPTDISAIEPNRAFVISVVAMAAATLWIALWLAISGAGGNGVVTQVWGQLIYRTVLLARADSRVV